MKVILLCAGLGSRLNSKIPKGLIKVKNKTLLEICVKNFLSKKINKKNIYFATGFKKEMIMKKFGKNLIIALIKNTKYKYGLYIV